MTNNKICSNVYDMCRSIESFFALTFLGALIVLAQLFSPFFRLSMERNEQLIHFQRSFGIKPIEKPFLTDMIHLMNKSIAIVGMVKDAETRITRLTDQLEHLCCFFSYSSILIFESNSIDSTPELLQNWQSFDYECNLYKYRVEPLHVNETKQNLIESHQPIIIKKLLKPQIDPAANFTSGDYTRLDRYAMYRRYLLNETWIANQELRNQCINNSNQSNNSYNTFEMFDYWMVIDLDIFAVDILSILKEINSGINTNDYEIVQMQNNETTTQSPQFSALCGNGIRESGWYYDSFATILRSGAWFYEMDKYYRSNVIQCQQFTPCLSCFGGMAIYNYRHIIQSECNYLTYKDAIQKYPKSAIYADIFKDLAGITGICEHIPFHFCLIHSNLTIAIARDAYVYYGFSP